MTKENGKGWTAGPWRVVADTQYGLHLLWTEAGSGPGVLVARTCFAPGSEGNARLMAAAEPLHDALEGLVSVIDRAGLSNLANGVQLGQTSWYVKASDALEAARSALSLAQGVGDE